jgi:hypothetical protein
MMSISWIDDKCNADEIRDTLIQQFNIFISFIRNVDHFPTIFKKQQVKSDVLLSEMKWFHYAIRY